MPVLKFHEPKAEDIYQRLVAAHGKDVLHDALRIHPESHAHVFHVGTPGRDPDHIQVSSDWRNSDQWGGHSATGLPGTAEGNRLENHSFGIYHGGGQGAGTKTIARQVIAARKMGIPAIHITDALRSDGDAAQMNGYYTWPRLGFNAKLTSRAKNMFPGHKDWHSVMADPENVARWKEHGFSLDNLSFETDPESPHSKTLLAYMKAKGIKV